MKNNQNLINVASCELGSKIIFTTNEFLPKQREC